MLQLSGGVGLAVDIADLLELQGALHRQRVIQPPPEVEEMLGIFQSLGIPEKFRFHGQ